MKVLQRRANDQLANLRIPLAAGALFACASIGFAVDSDLPSAATILDRHIEATGGKEAHLKLSNRRLIGKLEVRQFGHELEAKVEQNIKTPNQSHLLIDGATLYQVKANNEEQAWEWAPLPSHGSDHSHDATPSHGEEGHEDGDSHGFGGTNQEAKAFLLKGTEKVRALEANRIHAPLEWRTLYSKIETRRRTKVGDEIAYEVSATTPRGDRRTLYYSQKNGRLLRKDRTVDFPSLGKTILSAYYENYREFDGIWLPTTVRQELDSEYYGEGVQTWTYSSIQHNVEMPTQLFEVPDELIP